MSLLRAATRIGRVARATLQTVGHTTCIAILSTSSGLISVQTMFVRTLVSFIRFVTRANLQVDSITPHKERYLSFQERDRAMPTDKPHPLLAYRPNTGGNGEPQKEPFQILDEEKTLQNMKEKYKAENPLLGDEKALTELSRRFISYELGCLDPSLLAEDFQFVFPVVGPLSKADFVEQFSSFKMREVFPNLRSNWYNFKIDPLEPNRIWAMCRGAIQQEGTLVMGPKKFPPPAAGSSDQVCLPPQQFSFSFDASGKCYKLTGGYCVDRAVGDTGGLGGVFGILHGLGHALPFNEGRPWNKNTRSLNWDAFALHVPQIVKDWRHALRTDDLDDGSSPRKSSKKQ